MCIDTCEVIHHTAQVIESFSHRGLKRLFEKGNGKGLPAEQIPKIRRIVHQLDVAKTIKDMNVPGWHLHELTGNRKGTWSVTVNKNYRITFMFEDCNAFDVDYEDYH